MKTKFLMSDGREPDVSFGPRQLSKMWECAMKSKTRREPLPEGREPYVAPPPLTELDLAYRAGWNAGYDEGRSAGIVEEQYASGSRRSGSY